MSTCRAFVLASFFLYVLPYVTSADELKPLKKSSFRLFQLTVSLTSGHVCLSRIVSESPPRLIGPNEIFIHYRGADKSLARAGRKQATPTEDFEFHISYL
jgi:hypothetical protein